MVQTTFAQSRKENLELETIQNFLHWKICSHLVGFKCVRKLPKTQENPLNYQLCTSSLLLGKVHKQILSTHEMEGHVHPKKKWWSWFLQSRKCKFGSTYQTRLETSVRPKCSRLQSSLCKIWMVELLQIFGFSLQTWKRICVWFKLPEKVNCTEKLERVIK